MINVLIVFAVLYIPLMLVLGLALCRTAAAADRRIELDDDEPALQTDGLEQSKVAPHGQVARFVGNELLAGHMYLAQATAGGRQTVNRRAG